MPRRRVDIDRLHIRLRGVSPHVARLALSGLGGQILEHLAGQDELGQAGGVIKVGEINPDPIRISRSATSSEIRRAIMHAVAGTVMSKAK